MGSAGSSTCRLIWRAREAPIDLTAIRTRSAAPRRDGWRGGGWGADFPSPLAFFGSISVIFDSPLRSSDPDDLGGLDDGVRPLDRLPGGGLVVVGAVMTVRVPVLCTEELAASAPEPRQADLPPASRAPAHDSRRRRSRHRRFWLRRASHRRGVLVRPLLCAHGAGSGPLEAETRRGGEGERRLEAALAHVLRGGVPRAPAAVGTHRQALGNLQLLLLPLRHGRRRRTSGRRLPPISRRWRIAGDLNAEEMIPIEEGGGGGVS